MLGSAERKQLFIDFASREAGTTANEVFEAARERGDSSTIEAYHNLGRRLTRSGRLSVDDAGARKRYLAKPDPEGTWLDEDELQTLLDPEFPMESLAVLKEAQRQLQTISSDTWREAAALLSTTPARGAAMDAIEAYAGDLVDSLAEYRRLEAEKSLHGKDDVIHARNRCGALIDVLTKLCRDGLGLSMEAVTVPRDIEHGVREFVEMRERVDSDEDVRFVRPARLREEIERRVEDAPLVLSLPRPTPDHDLVVVGVDGSVKGGIMGQEGVAGDFSFGPPHQISLNTSVAVTNLTLRRGKRDAPVFLRLPATPEDIQRRENSYTIMSSSFFPDLADSSYVHATLNAMNVLEGRVANLSMRRWELMGEGLEVEPADVIVRDGPVVPNDRDPSHYAASNSYGKIVRTMIDDSWDACAKSERDDQTVAGTVKTTRVRVLSPIVNYVLAKRAGVPGSDLRSWAREEMNALPDQALFSRLLTHASVGLDTWHRSAMVLRPFHATSSISCSYRRENHAPPSQAIDRRIDRAIEIDPVERTDSEAGWAQMRRKNGYSQLLDNAWYATIYLSPGAKLSQGEKLPRMEILVPSPVVEDATFPAAAHEHLKRLLVALSSTDFEVTKEHEMFNKGTIDFVPRVIHRAHEIANAFANEMAMRAGELLDRILATELVHRRRSHVKARPWTKAELDSWRGRLAAMRQASQRDRLSNDKSPKDVPPPK